MKCLERRDRRVENIVDWLRARMMREIMKMKLKFLKADLESSLLEFIC